MPYAWRFLINLDIWLKKSEKPDPLKSFILQPLWNANSLGSGGCKMKDFNGPVYKTIPMSL
jgi:hypothetical protein